MHHSGGGEGPRDHVARCPGIGSPRTVARTHHRHPLVTPGPARRRTGRTEGGTQRGVTMPVDTRTIPNVPLIHVGEHQASTGTWEVGPDDLRAIVEAFTAGIATPVIKLGH